MTRIRTNLTVRRRKARIWSLKGSHKSAQGNALGIEAEYSLRALKGRNNLRCNNKLYRPFRACGHVRFTVPRALPWADLCQPFGLRSRQWYVDFIVQLLSSFVWGAHHE
jgi:hypothetical protein